MTDPGATVFVVDNDDTLRAALASQVAAAGFVVQAYATAADFLADGRIGDPGCLVCDVGTPGQGGRGQSGFDLLDCLTRAGSRLPVICMAAGADVPMAVRALKAGALEFIEKPYSANVMVDAIVHALARDREKRKQASDWELVHGRMSTLTRKERQSLAMLLEGASNKVVSARLSITERAVEMRRASIMRKLQVNSLAELIGVVTRHQLLAPESTWPGAAVSRLDGAGGRAERHTRSESRRRSRNS